MKPNIIKIILAFILAITGFATPVRAQFDAMFTQYMNNEMFINPAYAGSKEALGMTLLHRQQWVGFEGRPITTTFTVNSPLYENKMGVGLSFLNEKISVMQRKLIYGSYAYRIRVGEKSHLAFGLMAGIHLQTNNLSEISTNVDGDPQFAANIKNAATPNFGFGLYYYSDKFYAGLSIPRMIDDNLTLGNNGDVLKHLTVEPKKFHYYLTAGGIVRINEDLLLKPQLMVKAVSDAPVAFDIDVSGLIQKRFWVGLAYRSNADISAMAGIYLTPQFLLSYSYDYPITKIRKYTGGSHEIALSYLFQFKGRKIVSPRYF